MTGHKGEISCPKCKGTNPASLVYCRECATVLHTERKTCLRCLTAIPVNAKFCHECGQRTEREGSTADAISRVAGRLQRALTGTRASTEGRWRGDRDRNGTSARAGGRRTRARGG